jgi:hypothetical protein
MVGPAERAALAEQLGPVQITNVGQMERAICPATDNF